MRMPLPLSVANAKRVLVEATIFAPWGFADGGRTRQVPAVRTLLAQPNAGQLLREVYSQSGAAGRILTLCGLEVTDAESHERFSRALLQSSDTVHIYEGCIGHDYSTAEVLKQALSDHTCERIRAGQWDEDASFRGKPNDGR